MHHPSPKWRPPLLETTDWLVDRLSHYTERRKSFVVYSHGTAVFIEGRQLNEESTRSALLEVVLSPDFTVTPMQDGNFLVKFVGPIFGLVSGELWSRNEARLTREAMDQGFLPGEALLQSDPRAVKAAHHLIGLYARARVYQDVEDRSMAAYFDPRSAGSHG